jgi:hypothetical protein
MRFNATTHNLTIQVSANEIAGYVRRAVRLLVPKHTRKVYLFTEPDQPFEMDEPGLAVVGPKDLPANFLQRFRLILRPGELIVVSGQSRFTREQWRDLATKLKAESG